jgi:SAM-dependent methyltransferase
MTEAARYTHGHHESVLRSHRWRTAANSAAYLFPRLAPGLSLLDVGCGPGTITVDLAALVAPGEVVGVDRSDAALASAAGVPCDGLAVHFEHGDVSALPFASDSFDVVHAHQVLQHLEDPVAALREMARVCRPDGTVAVRDGDYASMSWYPAVPELHRWLALYRATALANGGQPDAGRHLVAWARAAGLRDVEAGASAWCFATPEDRRWWAETWAERISVTELARRIIDLDLADQDELDSLAAGWLRWAEHPDGWFAVLHGELLGRPG